MFGSVVGITVYQNDGIEAIRKLYAKAVADNGGTPVYLPITANKRLFHEYANICSGIIFSGGGDIHPKYYGERIMTDTLSIDEERDIYELELFRLFEKSGKPILGICRGAQLINVAYGGTLIQHIEGHVQAGLFGHLQPVTVYENTELYSVACQSRLYVNSFHHQVIGTVGEGLTVSAVSDDGYTEAVERMNSGFVAGVQWHPELFFEQDESANRLFARFIEYCDK